MMRHDPLLLFLALTALACTSAEAAAPPASASPPPVVRVAPVETANAPPVRAVGTLAGKSEMRLSFKNGGTVEHLLVEAGTRVRRGQLLASLNQTEITSQLAQAQAAERKAELDFGRAERLWHDHAVPQATYDDARTALDVAQSSVAIASYNHRVAAIVAPEDGVIEQRLAEVNELVGPGQPIYTLRSARKGMVLRVGLTDRDLPQVHLGTMAHVHFGSIPTTTFSGTVTEIAIAASPRSGTFEVEIKLEPSDARLLPGLIGNAELDRSAPQLSWVPVEALFEQNGRAASVFALASESTSDSRPGTRPIVAKRPVQVAYLEGSRAGISDGLQGVTRVVTDGVASCEAGAAVQLAP
jgi:RND family efflux transporter MFP subunit